MTHLETAATPTSDAERKRRAERQRRYRLRQRRNMRALQIDIRAAEIDALIRRGHLPEENRNDSAAIIEALYRFLNGALQ